MTGAFGSNVSSDGDEQLELSRLDLIGDIGLVGEVFEEVELLLGLEADGTHVEPATSGVEALQQIGQRRAAVAGHAHSHALERQPDGLLAQEHERRALLLGGADGHEKGDGHLLRVFQSRREADYGFAWHGHSLSSNGCLNSCPEDAGLSSILLNS